MVINVCLPMRKLEKKCPLLYHKILILIGQNKFFCHLPEFLHNKCSDLLGEWHPLDWPKSSGPVKTKVQYKLLSCKGLMQSHT